MKGRPKGMHMTYTGYTFCPCRDCFEIAMDNDLCNDCEEYECSAKGDSDCESLNAYGGGANDVQADIETFDADQKTLFDTLLLVAENNGAAYVRSGSMRARANDAVTEAYEAKRSDMMKALAIDFKTIEKALVAKLTEDWNDTD